MSEAFISGLDELQNRINQMENSLRELENTKSISFSELFPDNFIKEHTKFSNINEMFSAFGYDGISQEEFEKIPDSEIDEKIADTTDFPNWHDMAEKALAEFIYKKMGF